MRKIIMAEGVGFVPKITIFRGSFRRFSPYSGVFPKILFNSSLLFTDSSLALNFSLGRPLGCESKIREGILPQREHFCV